MIPNAAVAMARLEPVLRDAKEALSRQLLDGDDPQSDGKAPGLQCSK